MTDTAEQPLVLDYARLDGRDESMAQLLRQVVVLSLPVMVEHVLHLAVGLTDTYMANHLQTKAADGAAAVGSISYFLWFIGLLVTSIGTGATAIIARAKGARHKSLANSVCGQSATTAILLGLLLGILIFVFADPLITLTGLRGEAPAFALSYLRMLAFSIPFSTLMFVANSCLRGAGDTLTPAISMVVVDIVNIFFTYSLTVGACGLPAMGFNGIAIGTIIAYITGGMLQAAVLISGIGGIRLHLHRLRPHWTTLKRIFRIGIPSGCEGLLIWTAQFVVIHVINRLDASNRVPTAHTNAVRIEGLSYMVCFGIAMAAATLVGQSLGAKRPDRARRCANACYLLGGGIMTFCSVLFIALGRPMARFMSTDPLIIDLTAQCLFITAFCQPGFAAAIIFSGALRGAGDTLMVMVLNLISIFAIRLAGVLIVAHGLGLGLAAIWIVLAAELFIRGVLLYARFLQGGWVKVKV
ncbi:MAG: MATE family efflux transporter [Tepidisphaerales bacterium]